MANRWLAAIAAAACSMGALGCQSVAPCGRCCGSGCEMAFQKYDCTCDGACGPCCGGQSQACRGGCDSCCGGYGSGGEGLMGMLCGCTGCGECYWNEWHNDPPTVCEPCDRCGNYTGPGGGQYRAPYRRHEFLAEKRPASPRPLELAERSETRK